MANTMKDKVVAAGHSLADTAKKVGESIAAGAEDAVDFVKSRTGMGTPAEGTDVGVAGIKEHMNVIASCGMKVGVVDQVEGGAIKLTKKDSPDGQHHFIPVSWVQRVDKHVHLTKNSKETEAGWQCEAAGCGCGN